MSVQCKLKIFIFRCRLCQTFLFDKLEIPSLHWISSLNMFTLLHMSSDTVQAKRSIWLGDKVKVRLIIQLRLVLYRSQELITLQPNTNPEAL